MKHIHPSGDPTPSGYFNKDVNSDYWPLRPVPNQKDGDAAFARTFKNKNFYSGFENAVFQIDTKNSKTIYDGVNKALIIPK